MSRPIITTAIAAGLFMALALAGCSRTQRSRFYLLSPIKTEAGSPAASDPAKPTIGLGPIIFPEYLKRLQILTRVGKNEVKINEFHKWAEPLEENFGRTLAENLSALLPDKRVVRYPWPGSAPVQQRVALEILDFVEQDGTAVLTAHWRVYSADSAEPIAAGASHFQQKTAGRTYKAIVASQSALLEELSREIARALGARGPDASP